MAKTKAKKLEEEQSGKKRPKVTIEESYGEYFEKTDRQLITIIEVIPGIKLGGFTKESGYSNVYNFRAFRIKVTATTPNFDGDGTLEMITTSESSKKAQIAAQMLKYGYVSTHDLRNDYFKLLKEIKKAHHNNKLLKVSGLSVITDYKAD